MTAPDRDPTVLAREVLDADKVRDSTPGTLYLDGPTHEHEEAASAILDAAPALARAVIELTDKLKSGEASDGYHTHNELYEYRTLYHAHAARAWMLDGVEVTKSRRHADGELCFGGGWFIVTAQLPTGQVTNHYPERDWPLFDVPEVERPTEWDGHTPQEAAARIRAALDANPYRT